MKAAEKITSLVQRASEQVRSLTVELSPPVLYQLGFGLLQERRKRASDFGRTIADQRRIRADGFYENARREQIAAIIGKVVAAPSRIGEKIGGTSALERDRRLGFGHQRARLSR